ncbi:nucleotide-binding alpha-beta plait domain-containing protein [Tanacetum coccineum]
MVIESFLITNNLMGYVDGSIPCPSKTLSITDDATVIKDNPNYPIWVSNDAHVHMLIISTISEDSFRHVQGTTSHDLWLSLEKTYAPHSTSREYTLKTQLLRIEMHGDETPDAYLNRAQEYADALAAIGEPVKDKDLVMLAVLGLREEYNGLKTIINDLQSPVASSELHALLSDHDYMLGKTRAPALSITSSFSANYAVGLPSMPEAPNSHVTPDLEAIDNSEAYYGDDALHVGNCKGLPILHIGSSKVYSPQKIFSLENILHVPEISHNLLFVHKFCHDNDVFFEFHTSYFIVKDESTHTTLLTALSKHGLYTITLPQLKSINKVSFSAVRASPTIWNRRLRHPHQRLFPSSPRLPISSPSSVSHFSPTSQTSPESSNGQPSPISTTSIPTPPLPTSPPPPPPITRQRLANLCQIPKQQIPYNLFANHATVLPTTITKLTSFTVANNSPEWRQDMKKEYDALMKNGTWSLVLILLMSTTVRAVLTLAVTNNWPLDQLDIQNAFLHGNLKEWVYMKQPLGFINPQQPNHLCLLLKRILRYLHGTVEHGMLISLSSCSTHQAFTDLLWKGNPDSSLEAFSDADWA